MVGAQDAAAAGENLLVQGDGLVESSRSPVGAGEVETCGQGAGVVRAQDADGVLEVLLVQGDGFVEPARVPVGAGEFVAWGEGVGVVGAQGVAGLGHGVSETKG